MGNLVVGQNSYDECSMSAQKYVVVKRGGRVYPRKRWARHDGRRYRRDINHYLSSHKKLFPLEDTNMPVFRQS